MNQEVTINEVFYFDLETRPLWWFKQYMHEENTKGRFCGNLSGCYKRFKTAIERFIPREKRVEIYAQEKDWWIKYCERFPIDSVSKEGCLMDLKNNPALNARYEDKIMKLFFVYLKENGLEAKDYLNLI